MCQYVNHLHFKVPILGVYSCHGAQVLCSSAQRGQSASLGVRFDCWTQPQKIYRLKTSKLNAKQIATWKWHGLINTNFLSHI